MKPKFILARNLRIAVAALLLIGVFAALAWKFSGIPRPGAPSAKAETVGTLEDPSVARPNAELVSRMNPALLKAVGLRGEVSPAERIDLLRGFRSPMTADEIQLLLHLLLEGPASGEAAGWYSEYMHEICSLLGTQETDQFLFASVLASLASDPGRDEVVRDYSLQHLRLLWEVSEESLQRRIVASIEAIAADESPVAPSALLSLHVLGSAANAPWNPGTSQRPPAPRRYLLPDERIEPVLARILASPPRPSNTVARMTAARIIRERDLSGRLGDLRRMAADDSGEQAVVRMATIAALAEIGSPADIEFLNSLDRRDPRIDGVLRHTLPSNP